MRPFFLLIHSFNNKMKKSEIQALSVEQLQQNISVEKDRINKLKFAHAITPIENPMRIRQSRRLIAQLLTELNAR
jgi:large subunit ribosomal protein L29